MRGSSWLPVLLVAGAVSCGGGCAPGGKDRGGRPNVLLITIDTLRADRLGCYGAERPTSPNLDRLAREGLVFDRAYSQAPWTLPAMASVMTSLHPTRHGAVAAARDPLAISPRG